MIEMNHPFFFVEPLFAKRHVDAGVLRSGTRHESERDFRFGLSLDQFGRRTLWLRLIGNLTRPLRLRRGGAGEDERGQD